MYSLATATIIGALGALAFATKAEADSPPLFASLPLIAVIV